MKWYKIFYEKIILIAVFYTRCLLFYTNRRTGFNRKGRKIYSKKIRATDRFQNGSTQSDLFLSV